MLIDKGAAPGDNILNKGVPLPTQRIDYVTWRLQVSVSIKLSSEQIKNCKECWTKSSAAVV
jgi:hypothetical protein